jgi:hypothetical protein
LVEAIGDRDFLIVEWASLALQRWIGEEATRHLLLARALVDPDEHVRRVSMVVLGVSQNDFLAKATEKIKNGTLIVAEPPPDRGPMPSPASDLQAAQTAFDRLAGELADERGRQAARLQPALSAYLRQWDEEQQRLTRERGRARPADEIARAKQELVERVTAALERLDLCIYRGGQPCNLIFYQGESNRRGQFWLKPKGSGAPVGQKANLSDLFNFGEGEPQLGVAPPRREALAEWRERERARRQTSESAERGS